MLKLALALPLLLAASSLATAQATPAVQPDYGKLPLSFEANQGQSDPHVRFTSRGNGYGLFLTDSAAVLTLSKPSSLRNSHGPQGASKGKSAASTDLRSPGTAQTDELRMELAGANPDPKVSGTDRLPGIANYFIGNDPAKWHTNIPTYAKVRYKSVYPGVDLVYYGNQRRLEYDFIVAPGANPKDIRLHFAGAEKLSLNKVGDLAIQAQEGEIDFESPTIYQMIDGQHRRVAGRFALYTDKAVGFTLGHYDPRYPVVIDPTLVYSTYLGGSDDDQIFAIAVDGAGNAYLAGTTSSTDFPVTQTAYQTVKKSFANAGFIAKLDAGGTSLDYCTYLSGSDPTTLTGIAVDSASDAFVTGYTTSTDYPVTSGVYQARNNSNSQTSIITKLNPSGSGLVYSTYFGGNFEDQAGTIAVDTSGNAYIAGFTSSTIFPLSSDPIQATNKSNNHTGFVSKLNASGTSLAYSTYLGGSGTDQVVGIAVDASGAAYVDGTTSSTDFPVTTNPYQFNNKTGSNTTAFMSKISASGSALAYSTYLGGTEQESVSGIAVDTAGDAFVVGNTYSSNFPVTTGAYVTSSVSGNCAFVTKFNSTGTSLVYSTLFALNCQTDLAAIALDPSGNAYLTGTTSDIHFPVSTGAFQSVRPTYNSNAGFFTILNSRGTGLIYSTYYAGGSEDQPTGIALDSSANAYLGGYTFSKDFPTTTGSFQPSSKATSFRTGFVGKFGVVTTSAAAPPTFSPAPGTYKSDQSVTISDATPDSTIYYTTDGTTPTTSSPEYGGAIAVDETTTIQAIAAATGYSNSAVASATYTIQVATPVLSPGTGTFTSAQTVTITDSTSGSTIYYTTDGSTPTTNSTEYTAPIAVSATETIQAVAVASGDTNSAVASAVYTINTTAQTVATPTFSPAGGTYSSAQTVTISDSTNGSTIYYTTNGSAPTTSSTKYTGPITVSATETIEAIGVASGYKNSAVASAAYTINTLLQTVATPTFAPAGGTYTSAQSVTISDETAGATVYYTTNGSTPTTSSSQYTGPITVSATETIEAIGVAAGDTSSAVATATYTINISNGPAATPTFSPAPGSYTGSQNVTISDNTTGATVLD